MSLIIAINGQSLALPAVPLAASPNAVGVLGATVISTATTLRNLYVQTQDPGAGQTTDITVYKNGVATTLTVSVAAGRLTGADTTHSVACVAGDVIGYVPSLSGSSASTTFNASVEAD